MRSIIMSCPRWCISCSLGESSISKRLLLAGCGRRHDHPLGEERVCQTFEEGLSRSPSAGSAMISAFVRPGLLRSQLPSAPEIDFLRSSILFSVCASECPMRRNVRERLSMLLQSAAALKSCGSGISPRSEWCWRGPRKLAASSLPPQ